MKDMDVWHVEYLQIMQHFIIRYWNDYGRLPDSLRAVLEDALKKIAKNPTPQQIALFQIPRDPGTGVYYEYKITGAHSFELCANVQKDIRASDLLGHPLDIFSEDHISSWKHREVHICFSCAVTEEGY
jgi:hypothetical protein